MNETIPEKDNWFVAFWKALWAYSFGRIDSTKAMKINAAFGTMLMAILIGLGVPLAEWLFANFTNSWAVFCVGAWEAFAIFFGLFIIVVFGTTQSTNSTTVNMTAKQIEDIVRIAVSAALDKFINNNTNASNYTATTTTTPTDELIVNDLIPADLQDPEPEPEPEIPQ